MGSEEKWKDYQSVFTAAKAGMDQVDKEKVKKIVYEMSKDSAHFKNEQRKQANVDAKVNRLKQQAAKLSAAQLSKHTKLMDAKIALLEAGRDLSRVWLHVDMDAFYASVEELDNPSLRDVPMAVGGMSMISTANYKARKFGVRSAMPGFIAKKLCPDLVFVPTNFDKYTTVSEQTRAVFRCYDPDFEAGSLDEAYLDVTEYCSKHGVSGVQVAEEIRRRVREEVRVTCSCGVAPNKMLAKVCSDLNKPDGQYVLPAKREAVMAFISTLSIRKVPFVGKVTEQTLAALGIHTCQDVIDKRGLVAALLTPKSVEFFMRSCLGISDTRHPPKLSADEPWRKGISCERTFRAMSDPKQLEAKLHELVVNLVEHMARENIEGKTLTLKLKATSFHVVTRATTLPAFAFKPDAMLPPLLALLRAELPIELRLMGVRASNLRKIGTTATVGSLDQFITRISPGKQKPATSVTQPHSPRAKGENSSPGTARQTEGTAEGQTATQVPRLTNLQGLCVDERVPGHAQNVHRHEATPGIQDWGMHMNQHAADPGQPEHTWLYPLTDDEDWLGEHDAGDVQEGSDTEAREVTRPDYQQAGGWEQDVVPVELTLNDWQQMCMTSTGPPHTQGAATQGTSTEPQQSLATVSAGMYRQEAVVMDTSDWSFQHAHHKTVGSTHVSDGQACCDHEMPPPFKRAKMATEAAAEPGVGRSHYNTWCNSEQELNATQSDYHYHHQHQHQHHHHSALIEPRLGESQGVPCTAPNVSMPDSSRQQVHLSADAIPTSYKATQVTAQVPAPLVSLAPGAVSGEQSRLGLQHAVHASSSRAQTSLPASTSAGTDSVEGEQPDRGVALSGSAASHKAVELLSKAPSSAVAAGQMCVNPSLPLAGEQHSAAGNTAGQIFDEQLPHPVACMSEAGHVVWEQDAHGKSLSAGMSNDVLDGAVNCLSCDAAVVATMGPVGKLYDSVRPMTGNTTGAMADLTSGVASVSGEITSTVVPGDVLGSSPPASTSSTTHKAPWTCSACTYAGNLPHCLRCEVCDTLRAGLLSWEMQQSMDLKARKPAGVGLKGAVRGGVKTSRDGRKLSAQNLQSGVLGSITKYLAKN